jgi:predicted dehydrogenase
MKQLKVSVIGAGHWGPNIIGSLNGLPEVEVHTVCDLNEAALENIRHRFPSVKTSADTQATLCDPDVQAICIATPVSTHFKLAKAALEHGKHILVEKPLCQSSAECLILEQEAARRNLTLMVGHVFLFNPSILKVKEIIQSGTLGEVFYLEAHRTNLGPVRQDVNAIWDLTSHDISIFNFLLDAYPLDASAVGSKALDGKVEDTTFVTFRYPDSILAHAHASWLNPKKVRQITIVGSSKMMTWDDLDITHPIRIYDSTVTLGSNYSDTFSAHRMNYHRGDVVMPQVEGGEPLKNECRSFVESILNNAPSSSDGTFGRKVVEALEATDRSIQSNSSFIEIRP